MRLRQVHWEFQFSSNHEVAKHTRNAEQCSKTVQVVSALFWFGPFRVRQGDPGYRLTEWFVTLDNNGFFLKKSVPAPHMPLLPRISHGFASARGCTRRRRLAAEAGDFFCNVAHCASIELGCALVIVHVRFKWRTNLRISVCRPRSRRWWPIFKTCVCFACGCSFHYAYRLTLFDSGTSQMAAAPKLTA